jgi:hypothetical protein
MDPASSITGWVQSPSEPQRHSGNVQATKAAAQALSPSMRVHYMTSGKMRFFRIIAVAAILFEICSRAANISRISFQQRTKKSVAGCNRTPALGEQYGRM